jgi:hypothetical protein
MEFTHIANIKAGKVKGNSRIYPQLRAESERRNPGKKASIYEINVHEWNPAFVVKFDNQNYSGLSWGHTARKVLCGQRARSVVKPCRKIGHIKPLLNIDKHALLILISY